MQSRRLSRKDVAFLRRCAIGYFKRRFPKYSGLSLTLKGEVLIVRCRRTDPIPCLIREIPQIISKASIAIGISYVNLEINGQKIFSYSSEGKSQMPSLLEDEVVSISNGSHPELNIPPVPPSIGETEAVPLVGISDLSSELGWDRAKLLEALDYKNQRFLKEQNKSQMVALAGICFPGVKPEYIERALSPIDLFKMGNNYGIKESDREAAQIWLSLYQVPGMSRDIVDRLKRWNPDCINETPSATVDAAPPVTDTPKRRGRKPNAAKNEAELAPKLKRYQLPNDEKIKEKIKKSIVGNRLTIAAKTIVAALGARGREFLNSAQELDDRYISFIDAVIYPAVKEMGLAGKEAKEKKETLKSRLTGFFNEIATNDSSSQEI